MSMEDHVARLARGIMRLRLLWLHARRRLSGSTMPVDERRVGAHKRHVLDRLSATAIGEEPFHHLFVENILPAELYHSIHSLMLQRKNSGKPSTRLQDSADFVNRRTPLSNCRETVIREFRAVFADPEVKLALLRKFYVDADAKLERSLTIHGEFEFIHCAAGRFQNIHLDIPAKYLSFVLYLPEEGITEAAVEANATVFYDSDLTPHHRAVFRPNSVGVFAPHFASYHGFASTIERDVLVMFYVSEPGLIEWADAAKRDHPPFESLKNAIEAKLRVHPLLEYGTSEERLLSERAQCLVNAPAGRVMRAEAAAEKKSTSNR